MEDLLYIIFVKNEIKHEHPSHSVLSVSYIYTKEYPEILFIVFFLVNKEKKKVTPSIDKTKEKFYLQTVILAESFTNVKKSDRITL